VAIDMEAMLAKIKDRQWALADIDWDAPGADTVRPEFRPKLKAFMADLCWNENVGARGFAALAKKAPNPTPAEIYRYFHAEEQRHANAEMALMKRWGMLDDGEVPQPNVNIRLAIEWLDTYSDGMPLSVLGTVIPMPEVALDGALLKFPRIQHRTRAGNAQRLGGRQEPRRRSGPGDGHRGHLDHRKTGNHAVGRRPATRRRPTRIRAPSSAAGDPD